MKKDVAVKRSSAGLGLYATRTFAKGESIIEYTGEKITEEEAYQMMASSVLEQFEHMETDQQRTVMLATMTKMLVENFVLNLKLKGAEKLLKDIDNT